MGTERADLLAGPRIPDLHGSIDFSRDQVAAVGAERHGEVWHGDLSQPGREREDFPSGPRVPDLDGIECPPRRCAGLWGARPRRRQQP